jgi:SAM-dependent methyltransferase
LTLSQPANFTCNVCGTLCQRFAESSGREVASCPQCGSTVRLRSLVALLSREMFGVEIALPDFPALKSVRGIGMSDPPVLAEKLAEKFTYTNTFYHRPPRLDVTQPADSELGRYDFIFSSEVMEHVPPPVERAFSNLCRMLKPDGLLLLTVPYLPHGRTKEHFPELHEYALAAPGGRVVLVNRRRDGSIEVFENLCFHGGDGSTMEMRVFSQDSLTEILTGAGFAEIRIAAESIPEFGVDHTETWSLPMVARKGHFQPPAAEIAAAYGQVSRRADALEKDLAELRAAHQGLAEFHNRSHQQMEAALTERLEWVRNLERELEERTRWAQSLDRELNERLEWVRNLERELEERTQRVLALQGELAATGAEYERYVEFHNRSHQEMETALKERLDWARGIERELDERTRWAQSLDSERNEALAAFRETEGALTKAGERIRALEKELAEAQAALAFLQSRRWTRAGRKLGALPKPASS